MPIRLGRWKVEHLKTWRAGGHLLIGQPVEKQNEA